MSKMSKEEIVEKFEYAILSAINEANKRINNGFIVAAYSRDYVFEVATTEFKYNLAVIDGIIEHNGKNYYIKCSERK